MQQVKRVSVNSIVQADATGTGDWVVGKIIDYDAKAGKVTIEPADGSEDLTVAKAMIFKATLAEYNEAAGEAEDGDEDEGGTEVAGTRAKIKEDTEEGDEEDTEEGGKGMAFKASYREVYVKERVGNKTTVHCGDDVANELKAMTVEEVLAYVAKKTGAEIGEFHGRWGHLNAGQQRMCAGNFYRGYLREMGEAES